MSDLTYAYVGDVVKHEEDPNGDLYVYGTATSSALDGDQQRCSPEWLKSAMPAWWLWKNVREQHSPIAAGVGVQLTEEADDNTSWQLKSLVVDQGTKEKVKKGVLKGYSIGIRGAKISKSADAPGGLIDSGEIVEISLVDRPCNSDCGISIAKSAGGILAPVDTEGASVMHDGDTVSIVKGEAILESGTLQKTPSAKPTPLNMPGAKRAGDIEVDIDKATHTERLDEPAAHQTCADCGEDGHFACKAVEFDREKALELVKTASGDGLGQDESGDISGAEQAIAQVAKLIISEAQSLVDMPSQDCDIDLLMSAVHALRCFSNREKLEQGSLDPDAMVCLAADPDVTKKSKYDAEQMAAMLKDGSAMANANGDPSYPIKDAEDLSNAVHAVGRGKSDHTAIRKHIVKRAQALGLESKLPDNWNTDGSDKTVEPEVAKGRTVTVEVDGKSYTACLVDNPAETSNAVKAAEVDDTVVAVAEPADAAKAATSETSVDAEEADTEKTTAPDLVKTLTGALKDEDSELRELFKSILHDDTTAKALTEFSARLEQVENMAVPGGPALRRTEAEVKKSRQSDLLLQAEVEERKADSTYDNELKQGYLLKASSLRAQAKAVAA